MWEQESGKGGHDHNSEWQQQQQLYYQQYQHYHGQNANDPEVWRRKAAEWVRQKQSMPIANNIGRDDSSEYSKHSDRHEVASSQGYYHGTDYGQSQPQQIHMENYDPMLLHGNIQDVSSRHTWPVAVMPDDDIALNQMPHQVYRGYGQDFYAGDPAANFNYDARPNSDQYRAEYETQFDFNYGQCSGPVVSSEPFSNNAAQSQDASGGVKKKMLPSWLRDGLEKLERDKQKKSQLDNLESSYNKSDKLSSSLNISGYAFEASPENSPSPIQETEYVHSDSEAGLRAKGELSSVDIRRQRIKAILGQEQELLIQVRRVLTEILLEVTDDAISDIVSESLENMRSATATAKVLAPSTALAALGGLGTYGEDSEDGDESEQGSDSSLHVVQSGNKVHGFKMIENHEDSYSQSGSDDECCMRHVSSYDKFNIGSLTRRENRGRHGSQSHESRSRHRSRSNSPRRHRSRSPVSTKRDNDSHKDRHVSRHHRNSSPSPEFNRGIIKKSSRK